VGAQIALPRQEKVHHVNALKCGWKDDYRLQIAVYDIIKLQQEAYGISA
jgi:hypothetical protein